MRVKAHLSLKRDRVMITNLDNGHSFLQEICVLKDAVVVIDPGLQQQMRTKGERTVHMWLEGEYQDEGPSDYFHLLRYNPWVDNAPIDTFSQAEVKDMAWARITKGGIQAILKED